MPYISNFQDEVRTHRTDNSSCLAFTLREFLHRKRRPASNNSVPRPVDISVREPVDVTLKRYTWSPAGWWVGEEEGLVNYFPVHLVGAVFMARLISGLIYANPKAKARMTSIFITIYKDVN